jgi:hypothetical protein
LTKEKIDLAYFIRAGMREPLPTNCKTAVHSVFQFNDPHGDRYAYVSKWLSDTMSNGSIPYVPHIVSLPPPTGDFKKALGIDESKTVIGRIGGYYTFDKTEVKQFLKEFVQNKDNEDFVFLFVGTEPFIDHPNVRFINEFQSPQKKANFINTCDGMIHARQRGESFGLSIAEFLSLGKPVMAWNGGLDQNHISMLQGTNTLYNDVLELEALLYMVKNLKQDYTQLVKEFKPQAVMQKFKEVFIQ